MLLKRRQFLAHSSTMLSAAMLTPAVAFAGSPARLYESNINIDGLGSPGSMDSGPGSALSESELADIAHSGLTATHVTVGHVGTMPPLEAFEKIIRNVARLEGEIDLHPDILSSVRSVADIKQAKANGTTGLIYGLQDGVAFEDDIERLPALHHAGIRIIQPTYNRRNLLGDGCMEPADAGLSRTGSQAIERMQQLGIMVDLSHCGRRTAADAIALAQRPVSFTHTGCFALAEHPRHRTDQEIRAVAETGGIIGIFIMPYLAKGAQPTAADVIRHIDHAVQVAGEDHVSLGTDGTISPSKLTDEYKEQFRKSTQRRKELGIAAPFETEEGYLFASDLNSARRFETLAEMMLDQGYSDSRVQKILGLNLLRVYGDSWSPAGS